MSTGDDQGPLNGDDDALAAEYALGLLSETEARAFEMRLAQEPGLRAAYAAWAAHFARMTDDIVPVAPPARLRGRVMAQVTPAAARPRARRILGWLGGAAAALAIGALVLLFVGPVGQITPPGTGPDLRAELSADAGDLIIAARFDAQESALTVTRQQGGAAPGRVLQLWLIAGDAAPVSLGVLPEDATARLAVPDALRSGLAPGAVLAVSDEPPGGSPTGQPTGAVLAAGQITAS